MSCILPGIFCGAEIDPGTFHRKFRPDLDLEARIDRHRSTTGERIAPISDGADGSFADAAADSVPIGAGLSPAEEPIPPVNE